MKDSILKGTGNSRFLKSAVPAGTSWADALAMLQAGTFPVDFNGINAEGFQQVGTPLNKANLLKDATAAQIGLSPSTTPDGMFQALGNTGELHVWRKTITSGTGTTTTYPVSTNPNAYQDGDDAKEAGYTLGEVVTGEFLMSDRSNSTGVYVGTTLSANSDGTVNIVDYSVYNISNTSSGLTQARNTKGKYIKYQANNGDFNAGDVWFIPSDASIKYVTNGIATNKRQPVTGYAAIPAGTTIEYLGKLGDKAMVQVMSYVGTGTYGSSNPSSLTFDFVPKVVMIRCDGDTNFFDAIYGMKQVVTDFSNEYYVTVKWSKKTLSWYSTSDTHTQMNDTGDKYYAIAIG